MSVEVFDDRLCELGEGPLWHPLRRQLYWFDILGRRLLTRGAEGPREWTFDRHVSAAGWIDERRLLVASETDLCAFDLESGASERILPLEADNPATRSNDGRADPFGGFWIGTMGKRAEADAGAIYRYHRGELRRLFAPWTIPNAICFAPDGSQAFLADSRPKKVWRLRLDGAGWPAGDPELFLDQSGAADGPSPDGAVVDADGRFWIAEWGAYRVRCYDGDGRVVEEFALPARQVSCPAFGGPDLSTLFVTTAREHLGDTATGKDGLTYAVATEARGREEPRVVL